MPIVFDLSNLSTMLYEQAISLITCFGVFSYDSTGHLISESVNAADIRNGLDNKLIIPLWLSFSTGYELLFKAVLTKYKALIISKVSVSKRANKQLMCVSPGPIHTVYGFVEQAYVTAPGNEYLKTELAHYGITNIFDFSTGQLGSSIGKLKKLLDQNIISQDERAFLNDATWTLLDLRRNIDAHTFFGLTVGRSINGDLENVYLPAINMLLTIYNRTTV